MPPILGRPITPTGYTWPDENGLDATNTGNTASRSHDAQQPLSANRFVTTEPHRNYLGPVGPETYDPQARIDLENARYWIERKHKNWARVLLLKLVIHHPNSEHGKTAKGMLEELDQ
jgi:hypothetical protein